MNAFLKRYSVKKFWLAAFLIFGITFIGSYMAYDKFFAKKMMIASINPYNFTSIDITDLYVNETWGGNSHANSGGSSSVCCTLIPEKWRPGLVVNIKWKKTEDSKWYTAQAEIPPYKESAGLQVLFMKDNQIKVYINDYWPCTPMHPMPKDKELCGDSKKP